MALLLMAQTPHNNTTTTTTTKNVDSNPNPRFHEFLGSTQQINLPSSGETQMRNHFQGVPVYSVAPETTNNNNSRSLTKKRTNSDSDSAFMPQLGSDTLENFHLIKMLRNNMGGENPNPNPNPRRSHDEEVAFAMQPPKLNSNNSLGSGASKWERSLINTGASTQYPSNLTQYTTYFEKERSAINVGGSNLVSSRDSGGAGASIISPPAADEGSRTGMKGSGILSAINASNVVERNTPEVLSSSHRLKSGSVSVDPDSSGPSRQPGLSSATRQMTIFYAGQAHVFDEVHPSKADMIMALAGSNGGSWSTSFAAKSSVNPSPNQTTSVPSRDNLRALQRNLSIPGNSIHNRFNQGGHIGGTSLKSRRSFSQQEEANSEGNQDA